MTGLPFSATQAAPHLMFTNVALEEGCRRRTAQNSHRQFKCQLKKLGKFIFQEKFQAPSSCQNPAPEGRVNFLHVASSHSFALALPVNAHRAIACTRENCMDTCKRTPASRVSLLTSEVLSDQKKKNHLDPKALQSCSGIKRSGNGRRYGSLSPLARAALIS